MPNYGCVSLKLPATWSRSRYEYKKFINTTVGHENGKADLFLTKEPEKRHQFTMVNPKDEEELSLKRELGYEFVKEKDWTKNPHLWTWNPEGGLCMYMGQAWMARPAELYDEEEAARSKTPDLNDKANEQLANEAAKSGLVVQDSEGHRLKPGARQRA